MRRADHASQMLSPDAIRPQRPAAVGRLRRRLVLLLVAAALIATPAWALGWQAGSPAAQSEPQEQAGPEQSPAPAAGPDSSDVTPGPLLPDDPDVVDRLDFALGNAADKLANLLETAPLLLVALLVVLLFSWLGGVASRRLHWLRLRTRNPYVDGMLRGIVRGLLTLAGVVIALDMLDATPIVGAVLGSAGLIGLVVGFAFKDIAENYIASVLLSLRQPFAPGDHVLIDAHEGRVVALTSRATMLMTLDGNELRLPNALVFKAVILNYSRNPRRRFDFTVTIDAGQSIHQAQELAMARICRIDGLLDDPGPSWTVVDFTPAGIGLRFFGWVDHRSADLGKVRSEAIRQVKAAFAAAGIEPPRTIYHLVNVDTDETPGRQPLEPANGFAADTSVNTDIDAQLAEAQEAGEYQNLLEPPPAQEQP